MTFEERLAAIRAGLGRRGLDLIVAVHSGRHFIETPNPVTVLCGFKALGPSICVVERHAGTVLFVAPAWDAERAAAECPDTQVIGADNVVGALASWLGSRTPAIGVAGLALAPFMLAAPLAALLPGAIEADDVVDAAAACKTVEEIGWAREATRIAELNYRYMLEIAKPGMTEDELAVELRWHSKSLGAEDNFLLLCASPHNRAVQPSMGRKLQRGDLILAEITPSYRGQLAQICRTVSIGPASALLKQKYDLVVAAMNEGIDAARPGAAMKDVCAAINTVLEAQGYGEYCHPPHIRRRGHGLGFSSNQPGDVALDNDTILAPGMVFMIHPNQYLPETGYLLCGEPVVIGETGAEPLTAEQAQLVEIGAAS